MRQFKRFCAVTLLSLAIGTSAFAGDVQAPAGANPQPTDPIVVVPADTTPPPGDVSTQQDTGTTSVLTTITIELYLQLISVF